MAVVFAGLGGMQLAGLDVLHPASWFSGEQTSSASAVAVLETQIAVLPFTYSGDDEHARYGKDFMDLLGFVLASAPSVRLVDERAILEHIKQQDLGEIEKEEAAGIAEHFNAGMFVTGHLVMAGDQFQARVELRDASDSLLVDARVRGSEIMRLVGRHRETASHRSL